VIAHGYAKVIKVLTIIHDKGEVDQFNIERLYEIRRKIAACVNDEIALPIMFGHGILLVHLDIPYDIDTIA